MDVVRVETTEELGRILVATRDFACGETIFDEVPKLMWEGDEGFIRAFVEASDDVKSAIMSLYHPPLDQDISLSAVLRKQSAALSRKFGMSIETIYKLMLINVTNAFTFYGGHLPSAEHIIKTDSPTKDGKSALFSVGSLFAHSCCPNVTRTSKLGYFMRFIAAKPISKGQMLTITYIVHLSAPTNERRKDLMISKNFFCRCERCMGPDDCRPLRCISRGCKGISLRGGESPDGSEDKPWECKTCMMRFSDEQMQPKLEQERILEKMKDIMESRLTAGAYKSPSELENALRQAEELAPTHYLVTHFLQKLSLWYASQVPPVEMVTRMWKRPQVPAPWGGFTSVAELKRQAALHAARAISLQECVAAGCVQGNCQNMHPPLYESSMAAMWAVKDWVGADAKEDLLNASCLGGRYLQVMRATLGDDDEDVKLFKKLESIAEKKKSATSASTGSSGGSYCSNKDCPFHTAVAAAARGVTLMNCSRCHKVSYCSKECQTKHWKAHKKECASS